MDSSSIHQPSPVRPVTQPDFLNRTQFPDDPLPVPDGSGIPNASPRRERKLSYQERRSHRAPSPLSTTFTPSSRSPASASAYGSRHIKHSSYPAKPPTLSTLGLGSSSSSVLREEGDSPVSSKGESHWDSFRTRMSGDSPSPSVERDRWFPPYSKHTTRTKRTTSTHSNRSYSGSVAGSERGSVPLRSLRVPKAKESSRYGHGGELDLGYDDDLENEVQKHLESPLRGWVNWMYDTGRDGTSILFVGLAFVVWIRWTVGRGGWSGKSTPPLYGDFEAQRNWLSLTHHLPVSEWYYHNLSYWGLDYPPLTAYHSLLLSYLAPIFGVPEVNTLRSDVGDGAEGERKWVEMQDRWEKEGAVEAFMRGTVVLGDLLVWIPAVLMWTRMKCNERLGREKGQRSAFTLAMEILLQPSLILIDSGHFQYNSLMLGFALWSMIFLMKGRDLLAAIAFVMSLCFKQMALYYSPAVFAYLLGKCIWTAGDDGIGLFLQIGTVTTFSFLFIFSPFLYPPSVLFQSLHRIFPFARGLFEDKVANVWCALNVAIKFRSIASSTTLARLALLTTLLAVVPGMVGILYLSWVAGKNKRASMSRGPRPPTFPDPTSAPAPAPEIPPTPRKGPQIPPTISLLPHTMFLSAIGFFLFSFQVHEKSILLPLMPMTLLLAERELGRDRMDWEWAVLLNNVAVFSMWPLLKRDGLGLQYCTLTFLWNYLIGYNPISIRPSFVKRLSLGTYAIIILLHILDIVATPPPHLPDLFTVLNLQVSVTIFGLSFLWAGKRCTQEGWALLAWDKTSSPIVAPGIRPLSPSPTPVTPVVGSWGRSKGRDFSNLTSSPVTGSIDITTPHRGQTASPKTHRSHDTSSNHRRPRVASMSDQESIHPRRRKPSRPVTGGLFGIDAMS